MIRPIAQIVTMVEQSVQTRLPIVVRLGLALLLIGATAYLSLSPDTAPPSTAHIDKMVHAVGYAGLTGIFILLFGAPLRIGILVLLASGSFELLQQGIPHRMGSWSDLAANAGGIALAVVFCTWVHALADRQPKKPETPIPPA